MIARRISTHALLCVTRGRGWFVGAPDGNPVEIVAPAVVWLFPGVLHRYDPAGAVWREHWVLFEGTAVRAYEGLGAWRRSRPVTPATPDLADKIAPLFATLRAGTVTPGRRAELLAATTVHALIGLAAAATDTPEDARSLTAVEELVTSALGGATVAERARAAGISTDQLRRDVGEATSLSVHELVIRTRVERAQSLLATTDLPVAGIARQVGYDDPAYFSRLFSARVGVPPSIFRRHALR